MRGFRSTFIMLAVLAGLIGYIYFVLKPGQPPAVEQKPKVFAVESDKIDELQVTGTKGEAVSLRKVNGAWQMVSPADARADETEVSGIVSNLATLENQRTVDENASDLAQYGLAPPRIQVGFRKAGDKDFSRLLLGDKTATGADMYAKLPGESKVFLVSSFLETTFDKTAFDLRNKALLAFERDKVDRLDIEAKTLALTVTKSGDRWQLAKPLAARADTTVVDGLIGRLQAGQMKSIAAAEATPADLAKYGLDAPLVTARVGAGSTVATLIVGKLAPDNATHYARDAARPLIFTIEKSLADDLLRKPTDYRMKDVFEFRPFMATRLEVTRNGTSTVFEKAKDKDGLQKWTQVTPKKDVEAAKVEALLTAFAGLQVAEYVDTAAPGTETIALLVTYDDGKKEERATFARVGGNVFVVRPGEPGAARVDTARFDEAVAALDALK